MTQVEVYSKRNYDRRDTGAAAMATFGMSANDTVADLKRAFAGRFNRYYVERQRFTVGASGSGGDGGAKPLVLQPDTAALRDFAGGDGKLNVVFKDLGPQVGWTAVFVTEYAGPLFLYPIMLVLSPVVFGWFGIGSGQLPSVIDRTTQLTYVQSLALVCWTAHYAKRIAETLFVHRFSKGTMPLRNLYKNCSYYWGAAALVSLMVNDPRATAATTSVDALFFGAAQAHVAVAVFAIAQLVNFAAHVKLRNLRPAGSKEYKIPRGFPFDTLTVTCPNYTAEVTAWIAFAVLTQSVAALLFATLGAAQMAVWADGKHRRMVKLFGNQYPRRARIAPFVY